MVISFNFLHLTQQAYGNDIERKAISSISSLTFTIEIMYKYHYQETWKCLTSGLLVCSLSYLCFIPLFLLYLWPLIRKSIEYWFSCIKILFDNNFQLYSLKLRQLLLSNWTFESEDQIRPIRSIQRIVKLTSLSIISFFCLKLYSYLFFGVIVNLYITIAFTIIAIRTLWHCFDSIELNLYPLLLIITMEYSLVPIQSFIYFPIIVLLTVYIYPYLHRFLISTFIEEFINRIYLMNFQTYIQFDNDHKRFSAEIINLFVTICLIYYIGLICLTNNLSWILTGLIMIFSFVYLYTNLIRLISIVPNLFMFIFSSIMLSKHILEMNLTHKHILLLITLKVYFVFIYPLFYIIFRYLTTKFSNLMGLKLTLLRENIYEICIASILGRNSSKNNSSMNSSIFYQLTNFTINIIVRLFRILFRSY